MLGQLVGAYTDATNGMTLAAVLLPYYRMIMPYGLKKFKRFAVEVWGVQTDVEIANEGIAEGTFILDGDYKVLTKEEVIDILKQCM